HHGQHHEPAGPVQFAHETFLLDLVAPGNSDGDPARSGRYHNVRPLSVNADSLTGAPGPSSTPGPGSPPFGDVRREQPSDPRAAPTLPLDPGPLAAHLEPRPKPRPVPARPAGPDLPGLGADV